MESPDKETNFERNVWEIYRKEWAITNHEKRNELNERMRRWKTLMQSGQTPSQAYYNARETRSNKTNSNSFWTRIPKASLISLSIILIITIAYSVIITRERNILDNELKSVQNTLTSIQLELSSLQETLATTQVDLESTKQTLATTLVQLNFTEKTLASVQQDLDSTKTELENKEAVLDLYKETFGATVSSNTAPPYTKPRSANNINLNNQTYATNPTWQELNTFLLTDPTDDHIYWDNSFNCSNFTEMLHNNAETAGIKSAFVAIFFADREIGHALNAFTTSDRGLVYVDCTGPALEQTYQYTDDWDKIAYVANGKEYGAISINKAFSPEYWFYELTSKSATGGWETMGIVNSIDIYW
ncbi:MAG: hypothetical protein PHQ86_03910 [Dehalococcoidales bacterium]|nr:hypothetical protein [Dehalococcoidales bacterium]